MKPPFSHARGFSLVEVCVALGVISFALVGIVGLFPLGISTLQTSIKETAAVNVATAIVADLHQVPSAEARALNPALPSTSPLYGLSVSQASQTIYLDDNGTLVGSSPNARYQAKIALTVPEAGQRNATEGSVTLSWPPGNSSTGNSMSLFVALDLN